MITIFKTLFDTEAHHITVESALQRIKTGKSKEQVDAIRSAIDKSKADTLKKMLPSVCFSGKFNVRKDEDLLEHSGFIVLDFDNLSDVNAKKLELSKNEFIYSTWISPSGNGVKALVRIADGKKHRDHFQAMQEYWKDIDPSGINVARVCYESYDPEIHVNLESTVWVKTKKIEKIQVSIVEQNAEKNFENILKWLSNRSDAFVTGQRNIFMFKLASACCRFGISKESTEGLILNRFGISSDFTLNETKNTIKSAYARSEFMSASFSQDKLIDNVTHGEVEFKKISDLYDPEAKAIDVIYGEDVFHHALDIYRSGYPNVRELGHPIDQFYKKRRGELTVLTGYANLGKSTFWMWYLLCRAVAFDEKFGIFTPEHTPAEEFYHDLTEVLFGCDLNPFNPNKPSEIEYTKMYQWVSKHFFYIYPESFAPTPDYIKERFLSLIIKEGIDGCVIDPFNQLANDYSSSGGRSDKYLETFLSDCIRFAQQNNVYFDIIAHPKNPRKKVGELNYDCPEVFDIADGSMWANKADNILVYHRPEKWSNPNSAVCEIHSKKIRRQKIIGSLGCLQMTMSRITHRFYAGDNIDFFSSVKWDDKYYGSKKDVVNSSPIKPNTSFASSQDIKEDREWTMEEIHNGKRED